jgi:putative CocE/NonD family hydrolase
VKSNIRLITAALISGAVAATQTLSAPSSLAVAQTANPSARGSDIPETFSRTTEAFDHTRMEAMIPMRDGVRLFTVILIPKHVETPMPIVLTRTPYNADEATSRAPSPRMAMSLALSDEPLVRNGYIRVYQDARGKHGSEGDYIMTLPPIGPLNQGKVDHGTDTWDTIDWLLANVPNNNGRVGITGVSYAGYLTLMALIDPHPALEAAIPVNAMVDGWIGDDWFHNGAFRVAMLDYVYAQTSSRESSYQIPLGYYDMYSAVLEAGSSGELGRRYGADRLPAWNRLVDNPAYNEFWQGQAVDRLLVAAPLKVPTMTVHGLFDQEDIYGPIATYLALESKDRGNDMNFLVIGPWIHGQSWGDGSALGTIRLGADTSLQFREHVRQAFWDKHLKDIEPSSPIPPVLAYETGANQWRSYDAWPPEGRVEQTRLYLRDAGGLSFEALGSGESFTEYVSDPAKPVPYRVRPIRPVSSGDYDTWRWWLTYDQRPFSDRTDVVTFVSEPLTESLTISGEVVATLYASTSGSDADWVVKLIDLFPNEVPAQPELGGYELMISADILRGRYRESFETARPIPPGQVLPYRIRMPNANHTFRPGHRIMVHVQSSWFPLYDRNPQTFVPSIMWAQPDDYRKATMRVYHSGDAASFIELPVNRRARPNP